MAEAAEKLRVSPRDLGKYLAQITLVFAAYFVAGKLGQATYNIRSSNLGPVWPAYGVALAALLLCGYRVWVGITAAAFLIAFLSPVYPLAAFGQAVGGTLAALTGAFLLFRVAQFDPELSRLRDAIGLIALGAFGSALVSASIGVSVLYATHVQAYSGVVPAWLIYWLGDSTGVLLVTPFALTAHTLPRIRSRSRIVELVALLLLLMAVCFIVFGDLPLVPVKLHFLAFAALPFVFWAAIRFGVSGATLATLLVATIATTETALGSGPFAQNTPFTNAVLLDVFFAVLSVSGLMLAAVIAEQEEGERQREQLVREQAATEARLRLATIVESSDDAIIGRDANGIVTDWNKGAEQLYGYSAGEVIGKPISFLGAADLAGNSADCVAEERAVHHYETVHRGKDGTRIELSVTTSPIRDIQGRIIGASIIGHDISERKRQEAVIHQSEERFRLAAQAGKMFAYEWDAATDLIVRSTESNRILGIDSATPITGQQMLATVHPDDRERLKAAIAELSPEKPHLQISYRMQRPDGTEIWVERNSRAHFDSHGKMLRIIGMVADITDRKLAEARLREYEKAVEGAEEMIVVVDREYRYRIANRKFLSVRNMTKEQVVGHLATEVLNKGVFEKVIKDRLDESFGGKVVRYEMKYTYPELGERDLLISYFPVEGVQGIDRVACIFQDITDRKRTEDALRKSEERFRLAAQAGKMYAYEWDVTADVVTRSEEYLNVVGVEDGLRQPSRRQLSARVHPDDRARFIGSVDQLTPENPAGRISYRVLRPDGSVVCLEKSARAFFDEQGRMLRVIGMVADITDHKRMEEALQKSEEKFSKAFRQSPMALVLMTKEEQRYIEVNETFEHVTGWRRDEVIGRTADELALWVDEDERVEITRRVLSESSVRNLELRFRMRDGSVRIGLASAEVIELDGQPCLLGVIADITEHKRAEEALRESEDKLRLLLDSTAEAIYGIDLQGRCTFCNSAFLRALRYDGVDEVLGKDTHDLIHHSHANGTPFPVAECRIVKSVRTGEGVHVDDEMLWRRNGTSFPAEYWSYPQRRGQEIVGAVVAFIDITERKLAEAALASVSRRLIEAQEQERTRIARELHDDIGQRLALLTIELEQLQRGSLNLAEIRRRIGRLRQQATDIAGDIQSLSHELHSSKLEYLGIVAAIRGFCAEFAEQQSVEVDFKSHDLPNHLPADISLCLFRVLQEALHNSAKYSGVCRFEVRLWGTSDEVHLTVSDSGAGFVREAAKQTQGLGLISMEERLRVLNGTLSIESQPNRGTTIHARVPFSESDSMQAAG